MLCTTFLLQTRWMWITLCLAQQPSPIHVIDRAIQKFFRERWKMKKKCTKSVPTVYKRGLHSKKFPKIACCGPNISPCYASIHTGRVPLDTCWYVVQYISARTSIEQQTKNAHIFGVFFRLKPTFRGSIYGWQHPPAPIFGICVKEVYMYLACEYQTWLIGWQVVIVQWKTGYVFEKSIFVQ